MSSPPQREETMPKGNDTSLWLLRIVGAIAGIGLAAGTLASSASAADDTTEQRLLNAAQEQDNWIHHHHDYTAQRYSPLNQINRNNVKGLHVAWTMALGGVEGGGIWSHGGLEGTPIVENGSCTSPTAGGPSTRSMYT